MEDLVGLAVLAAFCSGQYVESGAIGFFMLIASFIEHRTAVGARASIESLIRLAPQRAAKLTAEGEVETNAKDLLPGDCVRVRPGDSVPGDGVIRVGTSVIDQANITGESLPVTKGAGDEVFGGTINRTGVLDVQVTRAGQDSTLGRVQGLIRQAAASRPAVVRVIDEYISWYTPVILMAAGVTWFFTKDLSRSIGLLLVGCPCAIILSSPTAMVAALSAAARLGVLIKSVADLEIARKITAIVFDKTGTLTTGKLAVTRLQPAPGVDPAELLRIAASAEQGSKHPVARAIMSVAAKARTGAAAVSEFTEEAGRGVEARLNGSRLRVGREDWLASHGVDLAALEQSRSEGLSLLFVARDRRALGWIGLEDTTRPDAGSALAELAALGVVRRIMITGDRWSPARRVAAAVHCTDVYAEALPADKLALVQQLKAIGHTVAVVGDGVNDGPALAAGHISIAMGAAGSDVAINAASVALMNNRLNRLVFLIHLSKQTARVVRQNLVAVAVYIAAMVILIVLGYVSPIMAAVGHGLSSIAVVFNSARLVRTGEGVVDSDPALASLPSPVHLEAVRG